MSFFSELKRRNVFKATTSYAIVAWIVLQVADSTFGYLTIPPWVNSFLIVLFLLGLPLVLFMSWAFELTAEGFKPTSEVAPEQSLRQATSQRLNHFISGGLAVLLVLVLIDDYRTPEPVATAVPPAATVTPIAPLITTRLPNSIAVLPLANFSPDANDAYFAAGIHEEILNQLDKLKQLNVIARTTMRQYENTNKSVPEIATELNVQTVMEGAVRYADDRVRVTVQLIDAITGVQLWSETYEREFNDIFAIESDIALQVASALRAEFTLDEQAAVNALPTTSNEAYALYLAARTHLEDVQTGADLQAAIDKVEQALQLDPTFVNAYTLKSAIYLRLVAYDGARAAEGRAVGEEAARRAVELDPASVPAQAGLASLLNELGRWQESEAEYRKLPDEELDAYMEYAWHRFATGFPAASLEGFRRSIETNPLRQEPHAFYISALDAAGQQARALDSYRQGENIFSNWGLGRFHAINALLGTRNIDEVKRIVALDPPPIATLLIELMETPEQTDAVLAGLSEDPRFASQGNQQWLIIWAVWLNRPEFALELVARQIEVVPTTTYFLWSPLFAQLRQREDFKTLVSDAGLVDYWREYGWPTFCQPVDDADFECH